MIRLFSSCLSRLSLLFLVACLFAAPAARAGGGGPLLGLTVDISVSSLNGYYDCNLFFSTNSTSSPFGGYVVTSPTAAFKTTFQMTSAGISNEISYGSDYSDFNSFMQAVTNGNWTLVVTNATSTNSYTFAISAPGFTSNSLTDVNITFPTSGSVNVTNQPTFAWQGPSAWSGTLFVEAYDNFSYYQYASLPTSQTNWLVPVAMTTSNNNFYVQYSSMSS